MNCAKCFWVMTELESAKDKSRTSFLQMILHRHLGRYHDELYQTEYKDWLADMGRPLPEVPASEASGDLSLVTE